MTAHSAFNELGFLWSSRLEPLTLNPLTNSHNPSILLSPSRAPPLSAKEQRTSVLCSPLLVSFVMAEQYFSQLKAVWNCFFGVFLPS